MSLAQRYAALRNELVAHPTCQLLAVSKTVTAERLREAHALGMRHFGENYLQEALPKIAALRDLPGLSWHFIGRIQRNKTQEIAQYFDWVESVDRLLIAERLHAARQGPALNVLIEVTISEEEQKGGVALPAVAELADAITALSHLRLRGLMALVHPDPSRAEANFARLAAVFADLQRRLPDENIDTLSMGTSGDYPRALAYGATQIRLGTTLFGQRPTPKEPS